MLQVLDLQLSCSVNMTVVTMLISQLLVFTMTDTGLTGGYELGFMD